MGDFNDLFKSRSNSTVVTGGIGPTSLLGIVFVVLKLVGVISWSWWWVLAPFWVPLLLAIIIIGSIIGIYLYESNYYKRKMNKARKKVEEQNKNAASAKKETETKKEEVTEDTKLKTKSTSETKQPKKKTSKKKTSSVDNGNINQ